MQCGHCICLKWVESYTVVKQTAFDLQQKETGSKTIAITTSKYASCGAFLSVQHACQIPIVLHHYLQRYSLFCVLTFILSHLMTSSVPNFICIIQKSWISLEREEIWQKEKRHSSSLLKAFQISLFFNSSIFHFIGTLSLSYRLEIMLKRSLFRCYFRLTCLTIISWVSLKQMHR